MGTAVLRRPALVGGVAAAAVGAVVVSRSRDPDPPAWDTDPPPAVAVVFGGGALYGTAWHMAVAGVLTESGTSFDSVPLVGTSAGSWVAAALRVGAPLEVLHGLPLFGRPDRRPGFLARFARDIFGDQYAPGLTVCALETTTLRRRLLSGADHPVHDLVAASSAVPGVFAPHRVGGRLYIDGGVRSPCSVAALPDAELLVVSLPPRGLLSPAAGRAAAVAEQRSIDAWKRRWDRPVIVFQPPPELVATFDISVKDALSTLSAFHAFPTLREGAEKVITPWRDHLAAVTGGLHPVWDRRCYEHHQPHRDGET